MIFKEPHWILALASTVGLATVGLLGCGNDSPNKESTLECESDGPCSCPDDLEAVQCEQGRCVCEQNPAPFKNDFATVLSCELPEPCPLSERTGDPGLQSWSNGECLLQGLRDRTPGRYIFESSYFDIGGSLTKNLILVEEGGAAWVSASTTSYDAIVERSYSSPQKCALKSVEALQDCLDIGTDAGTFSGTSGPEEAELCDSPTHWLDNCVEIDELLCPAP